MCSPVVRGSLESEGRAMAPTRCRPAFARLGWVALAGALCGCAGQRTGAEREILVPRYVLGAFGGTAVDARDICESGRAAQVRTTRRAVDYAVGVLSLGLYVPHRLVLHCEKAR
jgi:hypothetical protein